MVDRIVIEGDEFLEVIEPLRGLSIEGARDALQAITMRLYDRADALRRQHEFSAMLTCDLGLLYINGHGLAHLIFEPGKGVVGIEFKQFGGNPFPGGLLYRSAKSATYLSLTPVDIAHQYDRAALPIYRAFFDYLPVIEPKEMWGNLWPALEPAILARPTWRPRRMIQQK